VRGGRGRKNFYVWVYFGAITKLDCRCAVKMRLHHNIMGVVCRKNSLEGKRRLTLKGNYSNDVFFLLLKTFNIELVEAIKLTYG